MRIGIVLRLTAIVLSCLICAPAAAAPGALTVAIDHADQAPDLITGRWIDLVATVDPGGGGLRLDGLEVTTEVGARAETAGAVLPPTHEQGIYRKPFDVRVPVRLLEGGATRATVTVAGSRPDGSAFGASGEVALRAWGSDPAAAEAASRIGVSAGLVDEPAVVGVPNAVRVRITVQPGWHVYGAQVEIGVPTAVTLLGPGPDRAWEGGGAVVPDGDHLDGVVTVDIPFTPVRAGAVDARVSVLHMPCTEQMCDPVGLLYAPVSFPVVAKAGGAGPAEAEVGAELSLDYDGADLSMMLYPGEPLDLLVEVAPAGPLDPGALSLAVEADGASTGEPVFPPPAGGAERYEAPFVVRVPFTADRVGKIAVRATLRRGGAALGEVEDELEAFKPLDVGGGLPGIDLGGAAAPDGPQLTAVDGGLRDTPAVAGEPNAVVLRVSVVDGWHVYGADEEVGQETRASLLPGGPERHWVGGGPVTPAGKHLGGTFTIEIPFTPVAEGRVEARARVVWMACTEEFCDSTKISYVPVAFDVEPGDADAVEAALGERGEAGEAGATATGGTGGGDDIATMPLFTLILLSIGAGLFALAMPCTYPMIPITISFFVKQAEAREGNVLGLALTYGLGIVLIFTVIGGVVGLTALEGSAVIDFANNAWVNGVLALLFLAFGLSLLGLFELRLPTWFDNLAMKASSGGGLVGVFAMGATLVITSFTCTAPLVGALLVAAGAGGNLARVVLGMAVFGLTMAVPFVFLSMRTGAIQSMPKSGEWMKYLKVTLGIVELGLVLKFVSNIDLQLGSYLIGRELFLALWLSSFAIAGLYLLGVTALLQRGARWTLTRGRAIAAAVLLGISVFLATGLDGDRLAVKEIEAFLPSFTHEYDEGFAAVVLEDYEAGLEEAQRVGAAVFLHFTGFQ